MVKQCRICLGEDEDLSNPMLRPCLCSGSMAYVHLSCLNQWRLNGVNPKSVFECPQCRFSYRFEDKTWAFRVARLLGQPGSAHAATVLVLVAAVWLAGFLPDPLDLPPIARGNRWLKGSVVVATMSIAAEAWASAFRPAGFRGRWTRFYRGSRNKKASKADAVILGICVAYGLCVALYGIYTTLVATSRTVASRAQRRVLDAPCHHEEDEEEDDLD